MTELVPCCARVAEEVNAFGGGDSKQGIAFLHMDLGVLVDLGIDLEGRLGRAALVVVGLVAIRFEADNSHKPAAVAVVADAVVVAVAADSLEREHDVVEDTVKGAVFGSAQEALDCAEGLDNGEHAAAAVVAGTDGEVEGDSRLAVDALVDPVGLDS